MAETQILVLKGLTHGISDKELKQGFEVARKCIQKDRTNIIVWDGDKNTYPKEDGSGPTNSFTRVLSMLMNEFDLQCICFKKTGKGKGLLSGAPVDTDEYGNMLGPFPFLHSLNTVILQNGDRNVLNAPEKHKVIEFAFDKDRDQWHDLGLWGLKWIKDELDVQEVTYVTIGKGDVVAKELEIMAEHPQLYPSLRGGAIVVDVARE